MKYIVLVLSCLVSSFLFAQGVSLGKDGKVYEGLFNPIFPSNTYLDIPMNTFHNLYYENGIKFSIKLVIGDDPFDRSMLNCEYNDESIVGFEGEDYTNRPFHYYRLVLLIENENATKEVEFTNAPAFYVNMEVFDDPQVFWACNNNTGTYMSVRTGNLKLGANSSLEICDSHDGEWFFSIPKLTGLTVSNYVLRTDTSSSSNTTKQNYTPCVVPRTSPGKSSKTSLKSSSFSINTDQPEISNDQSRSASREYKKNKKIKINDAGDKFWNTADKVEENVVNLPKSRDEEVESSRNSYDLNSSSKSRSAIEVDNSNSIIGKWTQISGNYGTNRNGESNYFYFGSDGTGYSFVPDIANRCTGYGVKTHFRFDNTQSSVSLTYTKQDSYCGTSSSKMNGKSFSAGFTISGNILTISGVKFRKQ